MIKENFAIDMFYFERDNTTFQSSPDYHGNTYRASFELYPFNEGIEYAVYKGMLNGNGPKRGAFCAAKAKLGRKSCEEDWMHVLEISKTADVLASSFNNYIRQRVIQFTIPLIAQMDSVSDFAVVINCFKPHAKKLTKGEYIILEDFIFEEFQNFSTVTNTKQKTDAFSHFSWHDTRDFVICGLQGAKTEGGFHLTTPTIHSLSHRFGPNDHHWEGIVQFFSAHTCNSICSGLNIPDLTRLPVVKYPAVSGFSTTSYCLKLASAPPPYS
ncbi:alpha-protein kinase vwkA-like [Gigantopelta aegis]|uniref:alpha-protein kinase vwkA-like n=1 Tax=Gigantopelta aegis TaxID=1735272 RepID=UPI001B88C47E|nr:alpha-protein kinase vwkA-like [Gigantopelta aegis]XP_041376470.1 alpha-protein kinase vwkA-like [Gigantopelta aegis]